MKPVIVGAGLAGLMVALTLAPKPVIVLSPRKLGEECASGWAQGGIAAAVGDDDDADFHAHDTIIAGGGICDEETVEAITDDGASIIEYLSKLGTPFDRDAEGKLKLGLEAAHSRRRIVHATDATGVAIMKAVIDAVRKTPSIEVTENAEAEELLTYDGHLAGLIIKRNGVVEVLATSQVVLATGGAGALWEQTSNPLGSWGKGLALAAKIGAALRDLEFMQFHPTTIDIGRDPMPLASEALRGEGCTLIDDKGERFTDELQPRDIVARALWAKRIEGRKTFLDARKALGSKFQTRFPHIYSICIQAGIDPATTPIPVSPAAHYHMGGVATDIHGRTNINGLWACGEVACTGLNGANRLASNSLLEAASMGRRVAEDMKGAEMKGAPQARRARSENPAIPMNVVKQIRAIMSRDLGVLRDAEGIKRAATELEAITPHYDMALVALMICRVALRREESRGAHFRTDFPEINPEWAMHQSLSLFEMPPEPKPSLRDLKRSTGV